MALKIVHYGEEVLHQKGEAVTAFDDALEELYVEMVNTAIDAEGIGLAAQQIGKALMFCVVDLRACEPDFEYVLDGSKPPIDLFMPMGLCNPVVEFIEKKETTYEEGCLSFPEIRGEVERPDWIRCAYQDIDGIEHLIECNGLLARCIQHEVDHLNGILFIDRMKKRVFKKIQPSVNHLKAKTQQTKKN